ncbi:hypothetical protein [Salinarimonas chemoclinalis]|uniref:hypothetical protein n=1 Tax=Salinarimonas chemoclinalis TaxID=3241599 RepID=UPI003556211E
MRSRPRIRPPSLALLLVLPLASCGDAPESEPEGDAPQEMVEAPAPALPEQLPVARQPSIPPPSAHIALNPGVYQADGITLGLSALRFELELPASGVSAEGSYEVINGVLQLTATAGETGDVGFPLECRLSRAGPSIALEDTEPGACGPLAGSLIQRDTRPGALDAD